MYSGACQKRCGALGHLCQSRRFGGFASELGIRAWATGNGWTVLRAHIEVACVSNLYTQHSLLDLASMRG